MTVIQILIIVYSFITGSCIAFAIYTKKKLDVLEAKANKQMNANTVYEWQISEQLKKLNELNEKFEASVKEVHEANAELAAKEAEAQRIWNEGLRNICDYSADIISGGK